MTIHCNKIEKVNSCSFSYSMDCFGTTVFTGGIVLTLGSFFTHVYAFGRSVKDVRRKSSKIVVDKSLSDSPMQVVTGGGVF